MLLQLTRLPELFVFEESTANKKVNFKFPREVSFSFGLLFIFLAVQHGFVYCQESDSIKSNAQLFGELLSSRMQEALNSSSLAEGSAILVVVEGTQDAGFIKQLLSRDLKERGFTVFLDSTTSPFLYILRINGGELSVQYQGIIRGFFWDAPKTKRTVSIRLPFIVSESGTAKVLLSSILQSEIPDTIPMNIVSRVENSEMPSTHAELPEQNFLDRLVEPLVIIGATGVAVYLFFQIRSGS